MEKKTLIKRIILVIVLIAIVVAIVVVAKNASAGKKEKNANTNSISSENKSSQTEEKNNSTPKKEATISELEDGTMYSIVGEKIEPEIVLKDTYFDTQVADIMLNFNQYEGKAIQVEGLYFANSPYTFVGRYSTSNLCPDCPAGISYIEYEWHGDKEISLEDSKSWIKVVGTLKTGNDGASYKYIDVASIEIMKEAGNTTVNN